MRRAKHLCVLFLLVMAVGVVGWLWQETKPAAAVGCDGDITYGEVISCAFDTPTTVKDLTFAGVAGDRVRVRVIVTTGPVNPVSSVRLGGTTICNGTFTDEYTCLLTSTGTYTLRIDAGGSGTGVVSTTIQRLNDPMPCPSIAVGPTGVTGSIDVAAEIDCRARAGNAGDRWRIRVVETAGSASMVHEVISPDGSTVCAPTTAVESTCLLSSTGTHRILVTASGGLQTGSYRLVLERSPNPPGCTTTVFATPVTATVDDAGELTCFKYSAVVGDTIRGRVVHVSGTWNPITEVLRPDGTTLCNPTFTDEFTCVHDVTGTYTVLVRDGNGTGANLGTAAVNFQRLNDPMPCPSIAVGPTGVTGSIDVAAEIDCRARAGNAGDRWRIRVVETAGSASMVHEVISPDGSTVCAPTTAVESTCLLSSTGTHRILVTASGGLQTGSYRLVLERSPNPPGCTTTVFATPVTATVDDAGELTCFKYSAVVGDTIRGRVVHVSGTWNPITEVLRPDGTTLCNPTFTDEFTCVHDVTGTYTVLVRDGNGTGANLGTAAVNFQRLNDPMPCPSIAVGPTGVTGSIDVAAEIDCRARAGNAGDRWRIRVVETAGSASMVHEVISPDGSTVCAPTTAVESTCLLSSTGTHRILVTASGGLQTGSYRLVLERSPNPPGCTTTVFATPVTATVDDAGELTCFKYSAVVGDTIRGRVVHVSGTWNPITEVLRPDGTTLCNPTFTDEFTCVHDVTGTYTVLVRDGNGTGANLGTAAVNFQRLNDPMPCPSIAVGPTGVTGSIDVAAEIDCRARAGNAGDRWRIRVVETAGSASMVHEVISPDGSTVCAPTTAVESTCLLSSTGTHRILVTASGGLQTGSYRLVLERSPNPPGCTTTVFATPVTATVDDAGELTCFKYSAVVGDTIRGRVVHVSGTWNPITEVLRPDGTTLCNPTFTDEFTCVHDVTGTYTVLVRDGNGTGANLGTAAVNFQRLNDPMPCPSIAVGPTGVTGSIDVAAEIDCRARAGNAGDRWRIRVVETAGSASMVHEVISPDGSTVCAPTTAVESTCLLSSTGTHRILVTASGGLQTGSYRLVLERSPNPVGCTAVVVGSPPSARGITDQGALDCVTFTGAPGQNIRVRVVHSSGTWNPITEVLRPNGTTLCNQTFTDEAICAIDVSGEYTILVRDGNGTGASTGTYSLELDFL